MTQEDKELLIKDLCARLPYGVKAEYYDPDAERKNLDVIEDLYNADCINHVEVGIGQYGLKLDEVKPYLFPMSSMTEEQQNEFDRTYTNDMQVVSNNLKNRLDGQSYEMNLGHYRHIDWLNANHFDYRGLIEKGLALDATGLNIY